MIGGGRKLMSAPATGTPAPSALQIIIRDLISVGIGAAAIFVKNPAHQQTAANIIGVISPLVQDFENLV